MIDADQMATWDMDRAQYAAWAAQRARERQVAPVGGTNTQDTTKATSGPETRDRE